jgi:hypothetical protein
MLLSFWLRRLRARFGLSTARRKPRTASRKRRAVARLCLEVLEDRTVPSTFTVTNTSDDANQVGSLRWAINQVNADSADTAAQPDTINFNITAASDAAAGGTGFNAATGIATIQPQSLLPAITNPVVVDGYTQPGASPNTLAVGDNAVLNIVLDGSLVPNVGGSTLDLGGLLLAGANTTIEGLTIQNFANDLNLESSNNVVAGNSLQNPTNPDLMREVYVGAGSGNTIGGAAPADRNLISGYGVGVQIDGSSGSALPLGDTLVEGNYIGTDATSSVVTATGFSGVWVDFNTFGNATSTANATISGNVISGWHFANVWLEGCSGTVVEGNDIGTDASGFAPLPAQSGTGILANLGASDNTITGNTIAFNGRPGVHVRPTAGTGNSILGNSIYGNGGLGIEIDLTGTGIPLLNDSESHVGPNNLQDYPVLTSATSSSTDTAVTGTFSEAAEPNTTLTLDFYANPIADPSGYGQGQTYLGSTTVTTDGNGNATFSADFAVGNLGGQWITATATDPGGNTSEFSADVPILAPNETFAQFLQGVLPQSSTTANSITIVAGPSTMPATVIGAVNALTNVTQPVTVTFDLGGGTYSSGGVAANPPPNVTFVVQNGTLDPDNPALTVAGGQVSVLNCTLTTSGNAPTLVVTGGNVTLLNDNIIQASTVFTDPAIAVTGGTVNLGTAATPGNNTLSVNSSGDLVTNTTGSPISAVGDTFKVGGSVETAPSLSFTSLATSAASQILGQAVTFTATVAPDMPGSATPTGTIDFYDTTTNTDLGKVTLSGGVASLTTSALPVGTDVIQASYAGDGTYLPSLYTITQSVTYNITLLSNLSHAQPAGSQFTFQVEPTDAAANNLSAGVGSVTAVGFAPASNPTLITPVTDGGAFTPLPNAKKPTSWQYILQTSKGLAAGTYVFYFTIQGDPLTHSLTFQVK